VKALPGPALQALLWAALGLEWSRDAVETALQGVQSSKGLDARFPGYIWRLLSEEDEEKKGRALIEAVLLLTNGDSPSRHNARAKVDRPFLDGLAGNTTESLGEQWRTRRFLDFWVDLREALSVPEREYRNGEVLILDDHPGTDFDVTYKAVARHLLGNPDAIKLVNLLDLESNGHDESLFRFFAGYQTLRSLETPGLVSRLLKKFEQGTEGVRFILVDQLFKLRGREEFFGDQVIRGLARWFHDSRDGAAGEPKELPEIIALSRTDDPKVIQAALRAGAKDYVLKSRFVSLPAVLERVRRGTSDPSGSLHRTFRVLYDLPKETIGLLRSARIPRIPFHAGNHPEAVNTGEEAALWSDLLTRLPKTDLHVHAGSVMSREFLALASLVMLARHPYEGGDKAKPIMTEQLAQLVTFFHETLDRNDDAVRLEPKSAAFGGDEPLALASEGPRRICGKDWIQAWGLAAKQELGRRLEKNDQDPASAWYRSFRAHLHEDLAIRDYLSGTEAGKKLQRKNDLEVAFYLLRHAAKISWPPAATAVSLNLDCWKNDDLIRVYLLVLASRYEDGAKIGVAAKGDILQPLFGKERNNGANGLWTQLHNAFFGRSNAAAGIDAFRNRGWAWDHDWDREGRPPLVQVALPWPAQRPEDPRPLVFEKDPIGYTLASGTRSRNLAEYLLGCEFSGAEHLRHPFLMHVYARQVILDWVRQGVFYAELKASPDGFINPEIGFEYSSVVQCLVQAFSDAQREVLAVYQQACAATPSEAAQTGRAHWAASVLGGRYGFDRLRSVIGEGADRPAGEAQQDEGCAEDRWPPEEWAGAGLIAFPVRLPCKASLVFVGKRHKSLREMILEAAGAAVMRPAGEKPAGSAQEFVTREFATCRVVGFDLAGQEDGYPPSQYAEEFGRLSRLHVPITVHAGENAPPQFIEDAILKLGAVRIGHGLALAEDRRLLARVRDERIAIELCPVCNHQTSQFHAPAEESSRPQRPYPLADFVRAGLYVTINTDNPIISNTSMVREYFQASYAFDDIGSDGKPIGMVLWEALRIIRMGFVCSFLNLPERSHMIELVSQYLFDLFSNDSVLDRLKKVAAGDQNKPGDPARFLLEESLTR
jgi:adenosine deaminase